MTRITFAVALAFPLVACGGGEAAPPPVKSPSSVARTSEPAPSAPQPVTKLTRAQVKRTVDDGLGMFLQNVSMEDWPVMRDGKFYGFRIKSIKDDWLVDVHPGDVVLKINGVVPEHPNEAHEVFRSLETAKVLTIELERDGKPRKLELPIVD
jgi:type II secretory pathway component PulC